MANTFNTTASASVPCTEVADSEIWAELPYQLVWLHFQDDTSIFLPAKAIAEFGAVVLAEGAGGASARAHLLEQILPAIYQRPSVLLELVQQMPFALVQRCQVQSCWRSPADVVAASWGTMRSYLWP